MDSNSKLSDNDLPLSIDELNPADDKDKYCLCSDTICEPLKTLDQLLNFHKNPVKWCDLIEPIQPRCTSRALGDDYQEISMSSKDNHEFKFSLDATATDEPEVLVCHDFKGNYLEDKYIAGSTKWDDYRFYNWAGVDIFCYFSHHFITIPVLTWINVAHRNGVKVIGTFIAENQDGAQKMDQILSSRDYMKQVVEALVTISKYCKFEGWLLNIETDIKKEKIPLLREFVEHLTNRIHEEVPNGRVIWYDSVTDLGKLSWQNELNSFNRIFFEACDGIFLNYTWTLKHLQRTDDLIMQNYPQLRNKVFVGIDVFGRNQVAEFNTHLTLAHVKNHNFSVAIFAPGWTHETLQRILNTEDKFGTNECNKMFIEKNDKFWNLLWTHLRTRGPTELPFHSSFCVGSGKIKNRHGRYLEKSWFHLGKQDFQPSVPLPNLRHFENAFNEGSCLKIPDDPSLCRRLYVCDFQCSQNLIVAYAFKRSSKLADLELVLHLYDKLTGKSVKVVCSGNEFYDEFGFKKIIKLDGNDVKNITINLRNKSEQHLPSSNLINSWEIRYFYLKFDSAANKHLVDIGVRVRKEIEVEAISILLGAISVHQGFGRNAELTPEQSTQITEDEFR